MADPTDVADLSGDELTSDERAALAAWAEDEPPDGFADSIIGAWATEPLRASEFDDLDLEDATIEAVRARPRIGFDRRRGRGAGTLGIVATFAAAAAVMLMIRVMPRASGGTGAGSSPVALASSSDVEGAGVGVASADATTVLAQHCSPCHDSLEPEAKAEALGVFDLRRPDWWSTMSEAQLSEARLRIDALGAATDEERGRVDTFVDAELSARGHAG